MGNFPKRKFFVLLLILSLTFNLAPTRVAHAGSIASAVTTVLTGGVSLLANATIPAVQVIAGLIFDPGATVLACAAGLICGGGGSGSPPSSSSGTTPTGPTGTTSVGVCSNGATNPPACNNNGSSGGSCSNGAINPPACDIYNYSGGGNSGGAPSCTPSCGDCSASCGGGTYSCTEADCSASSHSCNEQPCPPSVSFAGSGAGGSNGRQIDVDAGEPTTLSWNSSGADSCVATGGFDTGGATSGSISIIPLSTSSYQIICYGPGGSTSSLTSITVYQPVYSISADPLRVPKDSFSTVSWSASHVRSCLISGPGLSRTDYSAATKSQSIQILSQSVYSIACQTYLSPVSQSVVVNVVPIYQEF